MASSNVVNLEGLIGNSARGSPSNVELAPVPQGIYITEAGGDCFTAAPRPHGHLAEDP